MGEGIWTNEKCPKCNSLLLSNSQYKWCSYIHCNFSNKKESKSMAGGKHEKVTS